MSERNDREPGMEPERRAREEAEIRRLLEMAGPRPDLPAEDLEGLRNEARDTWRRSVDEEPASITFRIGWLQAVAALLLAALGVVWWWLDPGPAPSESPEVVARVEMATGPTTLSGRSPGERLLAGHSLQEGATLVTGPGPASEGRAALRTTDGVGLRLAPATTLRIASPTLVELERGAVYVDTGSRPEAGRTLAVRTPLGTTRDVGTRFAVRYDPGEEKTLRVRVREGLVRVERNGDRQDASAGTEIVIGATGLVRRRSIATFGDDWSWVLEAAPPFSAETVAEMLDWVSRETGWTIRFAEPGLEALAEKTTIHGAVGRLPPDRAAFEVLPAAGLRGDLIEGVLKIEKAGPPDDTR